VVPFISRAGRERSRICRPKSGRRFGAAPSATRRRCASCFDNGTPAPLKDALKGHTVTEAIELGWDRLANGELIAAAEAGGFELLLTTDKNMRYQQRLSRRKIGVRGFKEPAVAGIVSLRGSGSGGDRTRDTG